jgi:hypothetical protein
MLGRVTAASSTRSSVYADLRWHDPVTAASTSHRFIHDPGNMVVMGLAGSIGSQGHGNGLARSGRVVTMAEARDRCTVQPSAPHDPADLH